MPDWYYNLIANPLVSVEVAPEPERTRLYQQMIAHINTFADYETKTTRAIPVIALTRI